MKGFLKLKCRFVYRIHASKIGSSSEDGRVYREVNLPFVPQIGMSIVFDDDDEIIIEKENLYYYGGISYSIKTKILHICLEDSYNETSVAERLADYVSRGWQVWPNG